MEVGITVDGLTHRYTDASGAATATLEDFSLRIPSGEFVAILGPSGCGKTTLLLAIAGLIKPTGGSIVIGDTTVTQPYTDVGIVFQDSALLDWRTALRNILIQAEVRGLDRVPAQARALSLMEAAGLAGFEKAYPSQLSGGMRQRVALCRALVHDPPLLLMDEPFGSLDSLTREQMTVDLQALWHRDRKTVVFVTHSIPEAVFLADRVVVLSQRPARILDVVPIGLARPRRLIDADDRQFRESVAHITDLLHMNGILRETTMDDI
ncbi:ABC transporter ATP-binding protein [Kribbella sp. CA-253562]|uniref:ABC transporter ATP-binding protein n=1 Tax=Kribbella sp. CA-253562 TaxID=3239942 RepID=UPI003D8D9A30